MQRKFRRYVHKCATRKKSLSDAPVSSIPSESDEESTNSTCTIGTQYELMETPPIQLTNTHDEAVQATVETLDVSTQIDDLIGTDELQDEVQPVQSDHICEGNNDIKFHPLIIKHKGVFTNSQGVFYLYSCMQTDIMYCYRFWSSGIL